MEDVRNKYVPPTISETAFNCPHCGALAKQFWYSVHADGLDKDRTPLVLDADSAKKSRLGDIQDPHQREEAERWVDRMVTGRPFLASRYESHRYDVQNLSISKCYNCSDISIWIYDGLVWPRRGEGPLANPDLPEGVREDYDEANSILDLSPRGAAALL